MDAKRGLLLCSNLVGVILAFCLSLSGQPVDSFYLKRLKDGENFFLEADYKEAAKHLEIAIFGLSREKNLLAKAYVYLSLSYYYLEDKTNSERCFRDCDKLLGEEGLGDLEINKSISQDFERLLNYFRGPNTVKKRNEPTPIIPKEAIPPPAKSEGKKVQTNEKKPNLDTKKLEAESKDVDLENLVPLELIDVPPVALKRVQPRYPTSALRLNIEGTVVINVLISETGDVIKTDIVQEIKGAFASEFSKSTEKAVQQWKFRPASKAGRKVKVWMPISLKFKQK
jgi:TonB family protein